VLKISHKRVVSGTTQKRIQENARDTIFTFRPAFRTECIQPFLLASPYVDSVGLVQALPEAGYLETLLRLSEDLLLDLPDLFDPAKVKKGCVTANSRSRAACLTSLPL